MLCARPLPYSDKKEKVLCFVADFRVWRGGEIFAWKIDNIGSAALTCLDSSEVE